MGAVKRWTGWCERAQNAVTSMTSEAGVNPFEIVVFTDGVIRITTQSLADAGQAPAGTVTDANPSADVIVVAEVALVEPSVGGGVPDPDQTVKAMRNGPDLPLESVSVPARTWRPSARTPVL